MFVTSVAVEKPNGGERPVVRAVGHVPDAGVRRRLRHVRPHRLHRHEPRRARQRPHGGRRPRRQDGPRAPGRVPHRRRVRHVLRRPGPHRRHDHHDDLPEHELGDPHRVRVRRLAARPVPPGRRRHLHQGRRRRRRPRRQGRGGHPRGRPPQPGHHRRQRRRQRRRLRRHGLRPVRVVRGHPRRLDHPRRPRLPADLPRQPRAVGRRRHLPPGRPRHRRARLDRRRVHGAGPRRREVGDGPDQPGLPHRRHPHRARHAGHRARLRRQPRRRDRQRRLAHVRRRADRPDPGPGGQPHHRVLHLDRDRSRCRRSPTPPRPARPPRCWPAPPSGLESSVWAVIAIAVALGRGHRPGRRRHAVHAVPRRPHRHGHARHHRRGGVGGHLRPGGRQRRRHRRDDRRVPRRGRAGHGQPRRGGQHHQGRHQGLRHRLGRDRRRGAVRQLHRDRGHRGAVGRASSSS